MFYKRYEKADLLDNVVFQNTLSEVSRKQAGRSQQEHQQLLADHSKFDLWLPEADLPQGAAPAAAVATGGNGLSKVAKSVLSGFGSVPRRDSATSSTSSCARRGRVARPSKEPGGDSATSAGFDAACRLGGASPTSKADSVKAVSTHACCHPNDCNGSVKATALSGAPGTPVVV